MFYKLFKPAFKKAFFVKNIGFAQQKTSLQLYDPLKVLDIFKERPNTNILINTEVQDPNKVKTLYTLKSIRHFQARFAKNPTKQLQQKLFKANMHLVVEREIAIYKAKYFKRALVYEKKKRKKL